MAREGRWTNCTVRKTAECLSCGGLAVGIATAKGKRNIKAKKRPQIRPLDKGLAKRKGQYFLIVTISETISVF